MGEKLQKNIKIDKLYDEYNSWSLVDSVMVRYISSVQIKKSN